MHNATSTGIDDQKIHVDRLSPHLRKIAAALHDAGGRAVLVGGFVRDTLLKIEGQSKDLDVEVFGLELLELEAVLLKFGAVITIGRSFGVLQLKGLNVDFSLPRRDNKIAEGHRGFEVQVDAGLNFADAALRRDLTINSMGIDLITGVLLDPHGGQKDLKAKVLRAVDPDTFAEDPLRVLRTAQFAARFHMHAHPSLVELCKTLDLNELSPERICAELRKLLIKGLQPSVGFAFLRQVGLIGFFAPVAALINVPQDTEWHPEGDVWTHTMLCIDEMAQQRIARESTLKEESPIPREFEDHEFMLALAVLCHDFGKATHTFTDDNARIRSPGHDKAGVHPAREFLETLRISHAHIEQVAVLVAEHLAPALYVKTNARGRGYRRLARKLGAVGLTIMDLARVARADHFGRTTADALERSFPALKVFLSEAERFSVQHAAPQDVVLGRHLIQRGLKPGPMFSKILEQCRELQDSEGLSEVDTILNRVLPTLGAQGF